MNIFKSKFFGDPQNIIALGVTVISLCALIVSVIQTIVLQEERELMREQSRAEIWPYLELGFMKSQKDNKVNSFVLSLSNNGVGPAIVTDVKVMYKDSIAHDWWELFKLQEIPDSIPKWVSNSDFNGRVLKIGETIHILSLKDNAPLSDAFYRKFKGVTIEVYYKSIYGEQWMCNREETIKLKKFDGLPKEHQFD